MSRYLWIFLASLVVSACNCCIEPTQIVLSYDFENGQKNGWESFFSDYPVGEESFYELDCEVENLPKPLDTLSRALMITGNNHSDDLFSAVVLKLKQKPNTTYTVQVSVEVASNATIAGVGIGGSPDLAIGVGALNKVPANTVDDLNHYRPNFVSALQSGSSNDTFKKMGTIGVSTENPAPYTLITRTNSDSPLRITTNSNGEFWLLLATDSGFEGITTLYYKRIVVFIAP